jgi:uncharacterized protein YprB with RNaseH-like and TPR domain
MGKTWSLEDEETLWGLYLQDVPLAEISDRLNLSYKQVDSKLFKLKKGGGPRGPEAFRKKLWYEGLKIGHLDIETSNFDADAGFMLSWCLKVTGEDKVRGAIVKKAELLDGRFDRRIVKALIDSLRDLDVVTTFWGTGFDIPFTRSRALWWAIPFPEYAALYHWDLFYTCRSLFKLHRKSLDAVTTFLGIAGKTHLDLSIWNRARYGDPKALKYVYEHNTQDVLILEKLFERVKHFKKWTRKSI